MSDDDFTIKDGKRVVKDGDPIPAAARLAGTKTGVQSRRFDGNRCSL
jgi:hypothetical protein